MQYSDYFCRKQWSRQDADSSDERARSRAHSETVGSSTVARNGPSSTRSVSDTAQKIGRFEMADNGALFFDEVGGGSRPVENVRNYSVRR